MFKLIIIATLFAIILLMAFGLKAMYGKERSSEQMARALTWRVALSVGLFILLMAGMRLGWITPHQL